jgi:hypothetical protein
VTALLFAISILVGCGKSPPPVTDPAKAPWLLDPNSQIKLLKESQHRVRGIAAYNLGNMGAKAIDALPELERLAKNDPEPIVRARAKEAIDKIRSATEAKPAQ